jgi:hypothetical protein
MGRATGGSPDIDEDRLPVAVAFDGAPDQRCRGHLCLRGLHELFLRELILRDLSNTRPGAPRQYATITCRSHRSGGCAVEVASTHERVHVTRNGRDCVVLVVAEDLESLETTLARHACVLS